MQVDKGPIDEDHKQLLAIANRVLKLDKPNRDAEELKASIRDLYEYVKYHFKREETFMIKENYPAYQEHHKKHKAIIQEMNNTLTHSHHMGDLLHSFRDLVEDWVVNHIMTEDQKIRNYILEQKKH